MKSLVILIKDFDKRFPQAYRYLLDQGINVTIKDSLDSLSDRDYELFIQNADAIFAGPGNYDAAFLSKAKRLGILSRMGSGMDNIDLEYAKAHGITVTNSKGGNTNAVAEMVVALMLTVVRNLVPANARVKDGQWRKDYVPGEELYGKTIGLMGFGMIAQRVAQLLAPFSLKLIACDTYMDTAIASKLGVAPVSFAELLTQSDVISLHIPALKENIGLFNHAVFTRMKKGVYFINCARGTLVEEDALYEALISGRVAAAASDVFCSEPVTPDNKLLTLDNFIATPHIAGMTTKSSVDDSMIVVNSIVAFFNGKEPGYRVI